MRIYPQEGVIIPVIMISQHLVGVAKRHHLLTVSNLSDSNMDLSDLFTSLAANSFVIYLSVLWIAVRGIFYFLSYAKFPRPCLKLFFASETQLYRVSKI